MSSMRNAVHRPNYKERAQPKEREKWGLLEKHKDYSLRAKDYEKKKKRLKILREKAAERNPDEFHFGMMNSGTRQGQKITDRGNKALSMEAVKLLKTQDAGYLRTVAQQTRKTREKLEQGLSFGREKGSRQNMLVLKGYQNSKDPQHITFVGSKEEQDKFDLMELSKTSSKNNVPQPTSEDEEMNDHLLEIKEVEHNARDETTSTRLVTKKSIEAQAESSRIKSALRKRRKKEQEIRRAKLEVLKAREKDLTAAERELELQRARMNSSVGGVTKAGLKWKVRERKR